MITCNRVMIEAPKEPILYCLLSFLREKERERKERIKREMKEKKR